MTMWSILETFIKGQKKTSKHKPVDTVSWALSVANHTLETKSRGKYFLFKKGQQPVGVYVFPHMFGCQIQDSDFSIAGAFKYAEDIQDALWRRPYRAIVTVRKNPLRLEILRPEPPAVLFENVQADKYANYWEKIKREPENTYSFNGVLFYSDREHFLSISLAKAEYSHMGFVGSTGSGKTVLMYDALLSLAMRNSPERLSIVLCDRKGDFLPLSSRGEFPVVSGLPHLACPVLTSLSDISKAVGMVAGTMDNRGEHKADNLHRRILLVIDEFSDTIASDPEILAHCQRIVQKGRGLGVHLWIGAQKMAGKIPPDFYQNLTTRFVGSTRGNRPEAIINGGEGSQAHKLPTGQGIFEFSNGGLLLGHPTPVVVRSMYIPNVERNAAKYVREIRDRWSGHPPHFSLREAWKRQEPTKPIEDPDFLQRVAYRLDEGPLIPPAVQRLHKELRGEEIDYREAKEILFKVQGAFA